MKEPNLCLDESGYKIDELDRALIVASQAGLPLVHEPYAELGRSLGLTSAEVCARFQRMLEIGIIRRIGAVPNHYAIGYRANGMTVWDVDDEQVDRLGKQIGALAAVTHCYRRPRALPVWPYNLFAMLHGHNRDEVIAAKNEIAHILGDACRAHDILFSTQILKKTGLRLSTSQKRSL